MCLRGWSVVAFDPSAVAIGYALCAIDPGGIGFHSPTIEGVTAADPVNTSSSTGCTRCAPASNQIAATTLPTPQAVSTNCRAFIAHLMEFRVSIVAIGCDEGVVPQPEARPPERESTMPHFRSWAAQRM